MQWGIVSGWRRDGLPAVNLHWWSFTRVVSMVLWLAAVDCYWFPCV